MLDAFIIDWKRQQDERRKEGNDNRQPRTDVYVPVDPWKREREAYERRNDPSGVVIVNDHIDYSAKPTYMPTIEARL